MVCAALKNLYLGRQINNDDRPIRVTGEERRHPAIRQIARACIALARLRLEQEAQAEHQGGNRTPSPGEPSEAVTDSAGGEASV